MNSAKKKKLIYNFFYLFVLKPKWSLSLSKPMFSLSLFHFVYDTTEIANGVKFTIKTTLDELLGSITINYATENNIPDMISASTYALVTE